MKTTDEIFDNIQKKLILEQKIKNQNTIRILSVAASFIILVSIIIPIATISINKNTTATTNSSSIIDNSANGEISKYNSIEITYEELLVSLRKNQGFSLLIPKNSEEITSISNVYVIENNTTHWFDVLSNTKNSYWSIDYYNYGIRRIHKSYENYSLHEEIEFNGIKGYVTCDNHVFKGAIIFVFDFGDDTGVEFRYNGNFNEIMEPIQVLKDIFIEIYE